MTVDLNETISRSDGNMGMEFPKVRVGDIENGSGVLVEFTGKVGMVQWQKKDGESLVIEASEVDEPLAKSSLWCNLESPEGLQKLVDIICYSGVVKKINRKRSDFTEDSLKPELLKNSDFHKQLANDIQGCQILATVIISKDGKYANITKITSVNRPGATIEAKPATSTGTGEKQEGGW